MVHLGSDFQLVLISIEIQTKMHQKVINRATVSKIGIVHHSNSKLAKVQISSDSDIQMFNIKIPTVFCFHSESIVKILIVNI